TGKLDPERGAAIVSGVAEGCRQAGCALIGGETAEMPGMYSGEDLDLAGFVVGAAERGSLLPDHARMQAGDVLIGVASSGPHSNGYSLIRKIVALSGLGWDAPAPFAPERSLGEALLEPTRIYVRSVLPLIRSGVVKGLAHITGGGLIENPPRMLPDHLTAEFDYAAWPRPPVFDWLSRTGGVEEAEMRRAFNCGLGLVIVVAPEDSDAACAQLRDAGESVWPVGELKAI